MPGPGARSAMSAALTGSGLSVPGIAKAANGRLPRCELPAGDSRQDASQVFIRRRMPPPDYLEQWQVSITSPNNHAAAAYWIVMFVIASLQCAADGDVPAVGKGLGCARGSAVPDGHQAR